MKQSMYIAVHANGETTRNADPRQVTQLQAAAASVVLVLACLLKTS